VGRSWVDVVEHLPLPDHQGQIVSFMNSRLSTDLLVLGAGYVNMYCNILHA